MTCAPMPHNRFDWHERIKAVEREYGSARIAIDRLSELVAIDPGVLGVGPRPRDLKSADENLEGTYLIRMFAEFETVVRSFWKTIRPRARTQTEGLLDRVGDRCGVPSEVARNAQTARAYRYMLVHSRDGSRDSVTVAQARSRLATYLSHLPREWGD
jgi:hypothetical protein